MMRFADDISRRPRKYREIAIMHALKQDYNMKTNKKKTKILICSRLRRVNHVEHRKNIV